MGCSQSRENVEELKTQNQEKPPSSQTKSSSNQTTNDEKLVKVLLLHRHGARYPTKGALKKLEPLLVDASIEGDLVDQWDKANEAGNLEKLTDSGRAMSNALGKWLATEYFGKRHPGLVQGGEDLWWGHSDSDRVQETGERVWAGMTESGMKEVPTRNMSGEGAQVLDPIYRGWYSDSYKEFEKNLRKGHEFTEYAGKHKEEIERVMRKLGMDPEKASPAAQLDLMTALWEMIENETASHDDSDVVLNSLDDDEEKIVHDLSRWCWEKRFFNKGQRFTQAGQLLKTILDLIKNHPEKKFCLLSAHDYTVMSLLNILGENELKQNVGFVTYVLMEVYQKGDSLVVRPYFNYAPFADEHHKPVESVNEEHVRLVQIPGSMPNGDVTIPTLEEKLKE